MAYTFKHGDRPLEGTTIQRAVGRGGFGEVYYALTDSGKQVALKYLRENPEIELRGIAHVMNLKSPHLITIYDVRKGTEGEPFVVMEYIGGPSLRELLVAESNGLGPQKAAFFLCGIAKGLSYLHERGIVHRDLKPGNIFYDDGYVKIGDYGLSKHIAISQHSGQTVSVGTVHYMAPEIGSGNYTKAIDIYALGVILYEMLTGRLPFTGSSMAEILMRHLSDRPDTAGLPEPFAAVIAKALAKNPNDRYQDVNEMIEAVTASIEVSESVASFDPASLTHVPRRPEVLDPDRTMTTPPKPPPIPPLDAREGGRFDRLAAKIQEKTERLAQKFEERAAKWEEKLGRKFGARAHQARATVEPAPGGGEAALGGAASVGRGRVSQVIVLLAVTLAVSLGLMIVSGKTQPETVAVLGLYLVGGTLGALAAYFAVLRRSLTRNTFLDRIVCASLGALGMLGGAIAGDEISHSLGKLIIPAAVALGVCDWTRRIERGRRQQIDGGDAVGPAIVGLIIGGMASANPLVAAGLCAALSMLTQAAAAMWPFGRQDRYGAAPYGARQAGRFDRLRDRIRQTMNTAQNAAANSMRAASAGTETRETPVGVAVKAVAIAIPLQRACENVGAAPAPAATPEVASVTDSAVAAPARPRLRWMWGICSGAAFLLTVGCFIFLMACRLHADDQSGLLFGLLAGVAWQPFFLSKLTQRQAMPLWRGTLRMLFVSSGLCLAGGMISVLSFQHLHDEEFAGAIFGLVVGGLTALVCLFVRGQKVLAVQPAVAAYEPPVPMPPSGRSTTLIDAAVPSFVGRTANAGLSLVGKLLLLAGLAGAIAYSDLSRRNDGPLVIRHAVWEHDQFGMPTGKWRINKEPVPKPAVLGILAAGCLFLVMSRRHDSAFHILRGFLGCGCGIAAAVFALGPAYDSLGAFFLDHWDQMEIGPLVATFGLAFAALILLFWPKIRRDKPIVI